MVITFTVDIESLWFIYDEVSRIVYYVIYNEVSRLEPAEVILIVKDRLCDQYLQKWRQDITYSRKMRTYQLFKLNYNLEPYLLLPLHLRTAIGRYRVSCHSLAIETGRYTRPPLPPEEEYVKHVELWKMKNISC